MESEKNAMPNDMAKRGCLATPRIGLTSSARPILHALEPGNLRLSSRVGVQADGVDPGRGRQDVVHQVDRRIDFHQFVQPAQAGIGFRQQRPAGRTAPGVSLEALQFLAAQALVERFGEKSVELAALHSVFVFRCHYITCLYVRCSRRASSARPRFILDFTVPSGTLRTVAISL